MGRGAYAWDKNTSAGLCAKTAGGGLCARGGVFSGYYGIIKLVKIWPGGTWSELRR